jgi:P4 family phage/plasmid primase-like protien
MDAQLNQNHNTTQAADRTANGVQLLTSPHDEQTQFCVSFFDNRFDNDPKEGELSRDELADLLTNHKTRASKDGAAWAPATFNGSRAKASAREVCALVLDYDDGAEPLEASRQLDERGLCYILHTTHSHAPDAPKFRIVLPLAQPVSAENWPGFYERAARHFGQGQEDKSCKDASRLYFLPACPKSRQPDALSFYLPGALLNPDDVPSNATPTPPTPPTQPRRATTPTSGDLRPYVRAAFDRELSNVQHAGKGNRNAALNRAAFSLFQIVAAGELDAATVEGALLDAATGAGLSGEEARKTIQSARAAGLKSPRVLPEPKATAQPNVRPKASAEAQPETTAEARGPYALNEIGNGKRFADANRGRYLFDYTANRWRVYIGGVWRHTDGDDVERAAKVIEAQICAEAKDETDDDRRAKLYKHAASITKRKTRETMLKDAASELGMSAPPECFDAELYLLNVQNGTLDLRSFELRPHAAPDLLTKCAGTKFDPHATAPTWTRALELWQESEAVRLWLQKVIGLTLSGEVFEEMLLLLLGAGNNGKTTLLKTLQKLLGDYAHHAQAESLMKQREGRRAGAPAPDILAFKGARMLTASEIADDAELHSAFVKDATGRDPLTARGCHDNRLQTFTPQFMLWLVGNHKPKIKDTSNGIWRRVKLVPFDVAIAPDQRDPNLAQKLEAELPGILNWALEGLRLYYEEGLQTPPEIEAATQNYRAEQSPLDGFIAEACEQSPTAFVTTADLWDAWKCYCADRDEPEGTQTALSVELKNKGFQSARPMVDGRQTRVWKGIRLKF